MLTAIIFVVFVLLVVAPLYRIFFSKFGVCILTLSIMAFVLGTVNDANVIWIAIFAFSAILFFMFRWATR